MLDTTKEVQGIATYLEFRKDLTATPVAGSAAATTQILVTPDGYATSGAFVSAAIYRRAVTSYTPKKQWRASPLGYPDEAMRTGSMTPEPIYDYSVSSKAEQRLSYADSLFRSLVDAGWMLVNEPLFIECSKQDLQDVAARKTPSKVMYRITQSRSAKGFPTNLF